MHRALPVEAKRCWPLLRPRLSASPDDALAAGGRTTPENVVRRGALLPPVAPQQPVTALWGHPQATPAMAYDAPYRRVRHRLSGSARSLTGRPGAARGPR